MENSLSKMRPHLVSEWSEKNSPLTPDTVTFGSNKTVWWKGPCGHEWQTSIKARSAGEQCPICSGARVLQGYEWICKLKGKFLNGQSNADEIFAFSKLISVISQYIPDTCTNDESDNHLFTVTCMLAEALIDFATSADDIKTVEGETILKADGKDGSHKIMYYPDGMVTVYKNEPTGDSQFSEYNDGYLVYDFDIGDYSEFVDYANYISENEEEFEPDII